MDLILTRLRLSSLSTVVSLATRARLSSRKSKLRRMGIIIIMSVFGLEVRLLVDSVTSGKAALSTNRSPRIRSPISFLLRTRRRLRKSSDINNSTIPEFSQIDKTTSTGFACSLRIVVFQICGIQVMSINGIHSLLLHFKRVLTSQTLR